MAEPTPGPWLREGTFLYQLTETDKGEPVNLWSASIQGGGPFAASEAERENIARLIAKARHLPALVDALKVAIDQMESLWALEGVYVVGYEEDLKQIKAALALVQDEDHG